MHKCIMGKLPESFKDMFKTFPPPNRTCNFIFEKYKSSFLSQFPKYFLPKIWNNNSLFVKSIDSHSLFKKELIKELSKSYEPHVRCYEVGCPDCYPV